ncbi:hypothetical protein [Elizabethkingia miricola]|uniref:hypothetical protein n=1 Tax=Elizabethkingia miricola TaxID=172045 RepID=UPI0009290218|nr:hypothetical protein [Chryseobacterium sp.]OJV48133.1 MAG: hypothetical protein BGO40_07020 [Chryseobacterium sp. 39-10]
MDNKHIFYPEFDHPASQLSAFSLCIDVFIIALKNGEIVRFKEWLDCFKVRDIAVNDGISSTHRTINLSEAPNGLFNLIKRKKNEQRRNN